MIPSEFLRQVTLKYFLEPDRKSGTYSMKQSNIPFDSAHQNFSNPIDDWEKSWQTLVTSESFVIRNCIVSKMLHGTMSPLFVTTFLTYYWEYDIVGGVPGQENRSTLIYMRQNLKKTFVWREKVLDIDITYPKKSTCEYVFGIENVFILQRNPGNLETVSDEKWRLSQYRTIIATKCPM